MQINALNILFSFSCFLFNFRQNVFIFIYLYFIYFIYLLIYLYIKYIISLSFLSFILIRVQDKRSNYRDLGSGCECALLANHNAVSELLLANRYAGKAEFYPIRAK